MPPMCRMRLPARVLVAVAFAVAAGAVACLCLQSLIPGAGQQLWLAVMFAYPLAALGAFLMLRPIRRVLAALDLGLLSFGEKDFSLRIDAARRDELGVIIERFNALGEALRTERNDTFQRGMLLETVLEAGPPAIVANEADVVVLANGAARDLFLGGRPLEGYRFAEILEQCPEPLREAVSSEQDRLLALDLGGGEREVLHVSRRYFEISTQQHTLYLLRPMTRELVRQEVAVWKRAIRVINHELNNSLAPITSLVHSARTIAAKPEHAHRLDPVLATIEERAHHLKAFLEGYARFARLPAPVPRRVAWTELLESLRGLYAFRGPPHLPAEPGWFDPGQLQQVLINLLKNAGESGSPPEAVELHIEPAADGSVEVKVLDRGPGVSDEVLRKALLPFYSTKPTGTGLGLPLAREILEAHGGRLRLSRREGGGLEVACWLPPPPEPGSARGAESGPAEVTPAD